MPLSRDDLEGLKRPQIIQLTKLVASLKGEALSTLTSEIAIETGDKTINNINREGLPQKFRDGLWSQFSSLSWASKQAIAERVLPDEKLAASPIDLPNSREWQSSLAGLIPGLDLAHFNQDGFDDFPNWDGGLHYLLIRRHDDEHLRTAQFKITTNKLINGLPQFLTLRKNAIGQNKTVHGVVLKAANELYTIGQLDMLSSIRFARFRVLASGTVEKPRRDLLGLRIGEKNGQPSAHVVYGYQLTKEQYKTSVVKWTDNEGSLVRQDDESLVNELVDLKTVLKVLPDPNSRVEFQPPHVD